MDALTYVPLESGDFDDEFFQCQTEVTAGHHGCQQPFPSLSYFEGAAQAVNMNFELEGGFYPYQESTGQPSAPLLGSQVEDLEYIEFGQSRSSDSHVAMNIFNSSNGLSEKSTQIFKSTHTTASASTPHSTIDRKVSEKGHSNNPPHIRNKLANAPRIPKTSFRAEPCSNDGTRPAKRTKGPPISQIHVFPSRPDHQNARKHRSKFDDKEKKQVMEVRKLGACIECRFRRRKVSIVCHPAYRR
jgi:hypothetical protein